MAAGLLSALVWTGATATPAGALTLQEAVDRAVQRSSRVAAADAEAEAARLNAAAASWARLPSVQMGLEAIRSNHPVQVFSGLLSQEQFAQENFGSVDFQTGRFDLSPLNEPDPHANVRASVFVRQELFTGGRVGGQVSAAHAGAEALTASSDRNRQAVALDTERVYRGALLVEEQLHVLRQTLRTAEGHAERIRRLWEEGLALESDRLSLDAHVQEVRARLAAAGADSVEARSLLGMLTGADGPIEELLEDPGNGIVVPAAPLAEALDTASARGDVRAAEAGARAAGAGKSVARSQLLPSVEIGAGAEHNSEEFFGDGGNQWTVMVGARLLLDPGVVPRVRSASARERAAEESARSARENAAHEVRAAHARLDAAVGRAAALEGAAAAAREAFRLTERRHQEGLATALELTESQTRLLRTLLEAAAARHDVAIARAAYRFAAGTLLSEEVR